MYDIKSIESGKKNENFSKIVYDHYHQQNSLESVGGCGSGGGVGIGVGGGCIIGDNINKLSSIGICGDSELTTSATIINMPFCRRRIFQRQACLLSIMIAFTLGLALGVFVPLGGMSAFTSDLLNNRNNNHPESSHDHFVDHTIPQHPESNFPTIYQTPNNIPSSSLETDSDTMFSVSFIKDKELPAAEVFRNAFHLEQDKNSENLMIVKKLDANDGSIKEFRIQRTSDGLFRKGPERRLSKPSVVEQVLSGDNENYESVEFVPINGKIVKKSIKDNHPNGIIMNGIYWGNLVERSLPQGFKSDETEKWNNYVKTSVVQRLEIGCGRMQNRLIVFADGKRACARYRQNTDQIQGELFSFYLGQLLNLTNLAPSTASVIDLDTQTWSNVAQDITNAQWKSSRPVVLTKWLPDLEPAGIPTPFQPLERHLNKYDVWNITLRAQSSEATLLKQSPSSTMLLSSSDTAKVLASALASAAAAAAAASQDSDSILVNQPTASFNNHDIQMQKGLLKRLGAIDINDQSLKSADQKSNHYDNINEYNDELNNKHRPDTATDNHLQLLLSGESIRSSSSGSGSNSNSDSSSSNSADNNNPSINSTALNRLVELAQWSDLIVFDYLIANLDRVVNNLYNYQWNADIMAAPAHNLAKQINSQLLVFLDNESGLLHGYRLLKKYEAYHGLLLDNLCVFRHPTINALQYLRDNGVGQQLQQMFEKSTSHQIRDVLPSLPDKSIKILIDRIDRVLGQVQKCRDLFSNR